LAAELLDTRPRRRISKYLLGCGGYYFVC
jgi:hypothetical protein